MAGPVLARTFEIINDYDISLGWKRGTVMNVQPPAVEATNQLMSCFFFSFLMCKFGKEKVN